ncbi:hypothetical protein A5N82_02510 [Christensenella minuta]|jgi:hypothetical protein|uniref:Uncharacterized protein n=1 Tax=Christensenella minuta TaxID=626937 RepID=A0A136Q411_9FIRM|nr:hypothetical protein HMPREF3293_01924 [Christensenella minuta]OAQ43252.1 hypothetical protein A5N82_02510 [Christensenella minuta]
MLLKCPIDKFSVVSYNQHGARLFDPQRGGRAKTVIGGILITITLGMVLQPRRAPQYPAPPRGAFFMLLSGRPSSRFSFVSAYRNFT